MLPYFKSYGTNKRMRYQKTNLLETNETENDGELSYTSSKANESFMSCSSSDLTEKDNKSYVSVHVQKESQRFFSLRTLASFWCCLLQHRLNFSSSKNLCGICMYPKVYYHILLAGPSMSGKTAFARRVRYGQFIETFPTKGTEVSCVEWRGVRYAFWDTRMHSSKVDKFASPVLVNFPKELKKKKLVLSKYKMSALIYVLDASNPGRLRLAANDIEQLLRQHHDISIVLVLAVKKNRKNNVKYEEVQSKLNLLQIAYDRECAISFISNVTGKGIHEAMDWVTSKIQLQNARYPSFINFFLPLLNHIHLCNLLSLK